MGDKSLFFPISASSEGLKGTCPLVQWPNEIRHALTAETADWRSEAAVVPGALTSSGAALLNSRCDLYLLTNLSSLAVSIWDAARRRGFLRQPRWSRVLLCKHHVHSTVTRISTSGLTLLPLSEFWVAFSPCS